MRTIGHEELKQKVDRKDHFRLVMALGEWDYQAKHIPGSIHFATMRNARETIDNVTSMVGLENNVHFARYLRGIFDNR